MPSLQRKIYSDLRDNSVCFCTHGRWQKMSPAVHHSDQCHRAVSLFSMLHIKILYSNEYILFCLNLYYMIYVGCYISFVWN